MSEKIEIKVQEGVAELVIREGQANNIEEAEHLVINGVLSAPSTWASKKNENYESKYAHVVYSVSDREITLVTSEFYKRGRTTVIGQTKIHPDLKKLGINGRLKLSAKQLSELLKFNRIHFPDRDENMQIVSNLNNLKVRVEKEIEDSNDFKGNKKSLFEQRLHTEMNLSFKLAMPLYVGQRDKTSFTVDINFDITDGSVSFWLESVELKELQEKVFNEMLEKELNVFSELGITTIETL